MLVLSHLKSCLVFSNWPFFCLMEMDDFMLKLSQNDLVGIFKMSAFLLSNVPPSGKINPMSCHSFTSFFSYMLAETYEKGEILTVDEASERDTGTFSCQVGTK